MPAETVRCVRELTAPPDAVWRVVGDFGSDWHPDIRSCRLIRDSQGRLQRDFEGSDFGRYLEQRTFFSDSERSFGYSLLRGVDDLEAYQARVDVLTSETGGSIVRWQAEIQASAERLSGIAKGTRAIFEHGLSALAADLPSVEQKPAPASLPKRAKTLLRRRIKGKPSLSVLTTTDRSSPIGTLVLFLHGIGGNAENWRPQLLALGGKHVAAALDMRGYGESDLGATPSRIDDYCDDIISVADAFGAERLVLVGLSLGAWIATSFAMRHGDRLAGLFLAGGCTGMSEADPDERERFRAAREQPLSEGQSPENFAPAVVDVIAGPKAPASLRETLRASIAMIPTASYRDALGCFCNPQETFDFSTLSCPVTLVTGEHDRLAPPAEIRDVSERIHHSVLAIGDYPDVRFEVLFEAGHVSNLEQPERFNLILAEFLDRIPASQAKTRPSREDKRRAKSCRILKAAHAEFCENGFASASMDALARRAGVSKPTLYQYFGDKEGLFAAMLEEGRTHIIAPLADDGVSLVDRLWSFSWTYADFVLRPDMLSLARLTLGEAARRPESAVAYHQRGPGKAFEGLVAFITSSVKAGQLNVDDEDLAAQDLWSLILSGPRDHYLHYVNERPDPEWLLRSIGHGLGVFIKVYSSNARDDLAELDARIKQFKLSKSPIGKVG